MALDLKVVSQGAHHLLDLLGELARRGEDEGLALEEGVVEVLEDACGEFLKERAGRERERKRKVSCFFCRFRSLLPKREKKKKNYSPAQKVAVFPVPDWACWITSRPLANGTMPFCWIAEGFSKPY